MVRLTSAAQSINQRRVATRLAASHLAAIVPLRRDRAAFAAIAVPPAGVGFFNSRCNVLSLPTAVVDDDDPSLVAPVHHAANVPAGAGDHFGTAALAAAATGGEAFATTVNTQPDLHTDPIAATEDGAPTSRATLPAITSGHASCKLAALGEVPQNGSTVSKRSESVIVLR
jgi:hypothetical protein